MPKTILYRFTAAALALLGAWAAYSQNQRTAAEMQVSKLKDDLYVVRSTGSGNAAVYITVEGVILVDDKFEVDHENLLAALKTITDRPLKYVLNSHQHGDHAGGNAKLLPAVEILLHKNARANMVTLKQPGIPRVSFADEAQVFLGGKETRIRHFGRGHTNGDAVTYFPALRVIHTGDLFVNGPYFIPSYPDGGSLKDWPRTIDEVLKWDFDVVIPGHGEVTTREGLIKFRDRLVTMWSSSTGLMRQGKSNEDVGKMLRADFAEFGASIAGARPVEGIRAEMGQ